MTTITDRILDAIRFQPLDDDVLAKLLGISPRQTINQAARRLESQGRLRRYLGADGKIVNALADDAAPIPALPAAAIAEAEDRISEDEVKSAVRDHLSRLGFQVQVAWGRTRGVDIDARHPGGRRYLIEAKGQAAAGAQQVNYFLGALGELVQRMDDPSASYALALPDHRQYRGLVERLPGYAVDLLGLKIFWVERSSDGPAVVDGPA